MQDTLYILFSFLELHSMQNVSRLFASVNFAVNGSMIHEEVR